MALAVPCAARRWSACGGWLLLRTGKKKRSGRPEVRGFRDALILIRGAGVRIVFRTNEWKPYSQSLRKNLQLFYDLGWDDPAVRSRPGSRNTVRMNSR